MSQRGLTINELQSAVRILTYCLQQNNITFGIIGGAGCSLLFYQQDGRYRGTLDIDVVIQADPARQINADRISEILYTKHSQYFVKKDAGYGVFVPAARITGANGQEKQVEIEIFDFESWPNRPQYDLSNPDNNRVTLDVEQSMVAVLSPRWLLREKILSQHQRRGNAKAETDKNDVMILLGLVAAKCLAFESQEQIDALSALLAERPDLKDRLEAAIECPQVFKTVSSAWTWSDDYKRYYRYDDNGNCVWA
jgi:hypothetical protein